MGGLSHSNVNENSGEGYFLRQRRTFRAWTTSPWTTKLRFLDIGDLHLHVVAAAIHGEVAITLNLIAELTVIHLTQGFQRSEP